MADRPSKKTLKKVQKGLKKHKKKEKKSLKRMVKSAKNRGDGKLRRKHKDGPGVHRNVWGEDHNGAQEAAMPAESGGYDRAYRPGPAGKWMMDHRAGSGRRP